MSRASATCSAPGLVDFVGGIARPPAIALVLLLRISAPLTRIALSVHLACFALVLNKAFTTIRPIFRERGKINAEVTGRLTESLGGVRVIKGYHAEDARRRVFAKGVLRLLDNVMRTLTATSLMSLSASCAAGLCRRDHDVRRRPPDFRELSNTRGYFCTPLFLVFLVAPIFQVVAIGTQITEALAGMDRTQEVMRERPEDQDPKRSVVHADIVGVHRVSTM